MEKGPNIFLAWLSAHRLTAAAGLFCALLGVLIFWLYGLPGEAIVYLIGLCLVGIAFFGALSFLRFWRKHKTAEAQNPLHHGGGDPHGGRVPSGHHHRH